MSTPHFALIGYGKNKSLENSITVVSVMGIKQQQTVNMNIVVTFPTGSHVAYQTAYPRCLQQIWPGKIQRERRQVMCCLSPFSWACVHVSGRRPDPAAAVGRLRPQPPCSFLRAFPAPGCCCGGIECDGVVWSATPRHTIWLFTERACPPLLQGLGSGPDCFWHSHLVKLEFWEGTLTAFCLSFPLCDIAVLISVVGALPAS